MSHPGLIPTAENLTQCSYATEHAQQEDCSFKAILDKFFCIQETSTSGSLTVFLTSLPAYLKSCCFHTGQKAAQSKQQDCYVHFNLSTMGVMLLTRVAPLGRIACTGKPARRGRERYSEGSVGLSCLGIPLVWLTFYWDESSAWRGECDCIKQCWVSSLISLKLLSYFLWFHH